MAPKQKRSNDGNERAQKKLKAVSKPEPEPELELAAPYSLEECTQNLPFASHKTNYALLSSEIYSIMKSYFGLISSEKFKSESEFVHGALCIRQTADDFGTTHDRWHSGNLFANAANECVTTPVYLVAISRTNWGRTVMPQFKGCNAIDERFSLYSRVVEAYCTFVANKTIQAFIRNDACLFNEWLEYMLYRTYYKSLMFNKLFTAIQSLDAVKRVEHINCYWVLFRYLDSLNEWTDVRASLAREIAGLWETDRLRCSAAILTRPIPSSADVTYEWTDVVVIPTQRLSNFNKGCILVTEADIPTTLHVRRNDDELVSHVSDELVSNVFDLFMETNKPVMEIFEFTGQSLRLLNALWVEHTKTTFEEACDTYTKIRRANSPTYNPTSPTYTPASPSYNPTSPTYSPTSPSYTPTENSSSSSSAAASRMSD